MFKVEVSKLEKELLLLDFMRVESSKNFSSKLSPLSLKVSFIIIKN